METYIKKETLSPYTLIKDKKDSKYIVKVYPHYEHHEELTKYIAKTIEDFDKEIQNKVPIRQGCSNEKCFCTGDCQKIIGYRDKLPHEL